jgi:hypothetical protein
METDELKKIWQTLADNKLIDRQIAKENINQIIAKKGNGTINKMLRKSLFDYYLFLTCSIVVPVFIVITKLFFPGPFPNFQSYIGLTAVELFFLYMVFGAVRNRKLLTLTFNNNSIKEAIENVSLYLKKYLKRYWQISLVFGYVFLLFALLQFITRLNGLQNFSLHSSGFNLFASRFIVVIFGLMIIWPVLVRFEIKIRYSHITKEIEQLLNEINTEG